MVSVMNDCEDCVWFNDDEPYRCNRFHREGRTCTIEAFDDGVDEGTDGEWYSYASPTFYLSCGHEAYVERPEFCPRCGAEVVENDDCWLL